MKILRIATTGSFALLFCLLFGGCEKKLLVAENRLS